MSTIYVVVAGEYSDYAIHGIFDSEERAEVFIAHQMKARPDDYRIEDWELNTCLDQIERGLSYFRVHFENILAGDTEVRLAVARDGGWEPESSFFTFRTKSRDYTIYLWAKDEEAARKIANEKRVRYLVEHGL